MGAVLQTKPRLPGFISLLLVIALGISLAKLMWLVVAPTQTVSTRSHDQGVTVISQKQETNYGKLIADQHIFGVVKKAPVVKLQKPVATPKKAVAATKLNLKLHGIVAYKSKTGLALISLNNGPQKVYGKGELIQEGVTVTDILPEKVVLDNRGQTEELLLPINESKANTRRKRSTRIPAGNSGLSGTRLQNEPDKSALSIKDANNGAPDLGAFRQEVVSDPSKLMDIVKPSPAIVDGQFIGFRLQPGSKRKVFRQLNFRPNDIITEVNGIVLDDASKGAMVLGELAQATGVSVKVKRGDQELFIEHTF